MDKVLNPYEREYMRMAMLKHEETFKQQVYELHRLYRIQKILMRNIENNRPNTQANSRSKNGFSFNQIDHCQRVKDESIMKLDLECPAEENFLESSSDYKMMELIDETEIELTLGPASNNRRISKKPETPLTSDSGPSFSSSSTGSSHINRTCSFTRQTTNKVKKEAIGCGLGPAWVPEMSMDHPSGSKNSIDVEEPLRQERLKQPSWLFQVLSLNMT